MQRLPVMARAIARGSAASVDPEETVVLYPKGVRTSAIPVSHDPQQSETHQRPLTKMPIGATDRSRHLPHRDFHALSSYN